MNPHAAADCPMARGIGLLGDRWTLLIVREALAGASRYDEFRERLRMSDHTLSRKLGAAIESGLLVRAGPARGAAAGYRLTGAGADLARVLAVLGDWTNRWFPGDNPPPAPPQPVMNELIRLGLAGPITEPVRHHRRSDMTKEHS